MIPESLEPRTVLEGLCPSSALIPPLSEIDIATFCKKLPHALPKEIETLLRFSGGFYLPSVGSVRFTGVGDFGFPKAIPSAVAILGDDFGNCWVVDINIRNGNWGAVLFFCHDPPVLAIQASSLSAFLEQLFRGVATSDQILQQVRQDAVTAIWKQDPWLVPASQARRSVDPLVSSFAAECPPFFGIADLRRCELGSGFSWGKAGPKAEIRRCGTELLFAVQRRVEGLRRLFGTSEAK